MKNFRELLLPPNVSALMCGGDVRHPRVRVIPAAEYVQEVTAWLQGQGVRPGERLGVYLENSPRYFGVLFAALRLGLHLIAFNRRLTASELEWQVTQARPEWLIRDDGQEAEATTSWMDFSQLGLTGAEMTSITFFTSGTTGEPKRARLTLRNLQAAVRASSQHLATRAGERWLLVLPLYHVGGMSILLRAAWDKLTVVMPPRFEAEQSYRLLWEEQIHLVSLVPTMLYRLLPFFEREGVPPTLRLVLLGGAAAHPSLLERALKLNLPIALTYGLTEACSQVCTALPETVRRKLGTVGKPLPGVEMELRAADGHLCAPGEVGEIWVRGPAVIGGYEGMPPFADGWLATGDLGYRDADGDLWVLARRNDLILSGGENVYPAEVENVLATHPAVREVCVFGLEDAEWGQRVAAAVVTDGAVSEAEIIAYARRFLAGYKVPRRVFFVNELPRTASGKVKRHALAMMYK